MKHSLILTIILVVAFVAAQVIGIGIIDAYVDTTTSTESGKTEFYELPAIGTVPLERPQVEESWSWMYVLGAVLGGTIVLLLLGRFGKTWIWKAWFFLAVVVALYIAFAAFVPSLIAAIGAVLFASAKLMHPTRLAIVILQNISELFIYGGIAAIFVPIFNMTAIFIFIAAISAYDMYAVWTSKHMVAMAKFQMQSGVFAGLAVPYGVTKQNTAAQKEHARKVTLQTAFLGGGDIAIPLLFTGTVLKVFGLTPAFVVIPFTTLALFLVLYFAKKDRFYPAMPFLSAGCLVGLGVALLV